MKFSKLKLARLAESEYAKNSYLVFILNALFLAAGIISARVMNLSERGTAAIFVTVTGMITYILDLGVTNAIFIAAARKVAIPGFFRSLKYHTVFLIVSTSLSFALLGIYDLAPGASILSALVIFNISSVLFRHAGANISGSGHLYIYNLIRLGQTFFWLLTVIAILPNHPTANSFIWTYVSSWALGAFLMTKFNKPQQSTESLGSYDFFKTGISSFFSNQNAIDGLKLDQLAAAREPNMAAVAAVINSVVAQVKTFPVAIFPILAQKIHAKSYEGSEYFKMALRLSPLSVILMIPFAIFFFPLLMGSQYSGYSPAITWYLIAGSVSIARLLISERLRAMNRNIGIVFSEIAGIAIFFFLYFTDFIYNINQLAIAVLITQAAILLVLAFSWKIRDKK
jgi:hypothetical protein